MNIDAIQNGIVIDHIPAGKAMELYHYLNLDKLDASVAILKKVSSRKLGKKDMIKIDERIDIDIDALGFLAPHCTVSFIQNGETIEKKTPQLPDTLVNVIKCRNPRCITTIEQELKHVFTLSDREKGIYRCIYCETKA